MVMQRDRVDALPPILCDKCGKRAALLDRLPTRKSDYHIHRSCWPCAVDFYTANKAELVKAALPEYLRQLAQAEGAP